MGGQMDVATQVPLFDGVPEKPVDQNTTKIPQNHTKRPISPGAEERLGETLPCLNKGFVRLVDYMGGDARIVQSARVSYGDGTVSKRKDKNLIDYLLRHSHTSPFEQVVFTFHLKLPIFVARQWIRHRMARLNEISGRYSHMRDEFYVPFGHTIRRQSQQNKQGRSDEEVPTELRVQVLEALTAEQESAYAQYEQLLENGIARELARVNLPGSLYTEMYWQIDLHNLFHFLRLRMDSHAQYEIREYAEQIALIVQEAVPWAYESFEEHILHGVRLSGSEVRAVADSLDTRYLHALLSENKVKKTRQRELFAKLGFDYAQLNGSQSETSETESFPSPAD